MISTVTVSTVSTVTNAMFAGSLALIGIAILLIFLVQKELATVAGDRFHNMARILNIGIIPLLFAFILIVASKVLAVLP